MGRLLGKAFVFLLLGALLLSPVAVATRRAYRRAFASPVFRLPAGTTWLLAGDSHTQTALDPMWLPGAQSIARRGENYFYTYYKLRHFLARNPGITRVVLGCSWHNFARANQDELMDMNLTAYFPLLDDEGQAVVRSWETDFLVPWARNVLGVPLNVYDDRLLQAAWRGAAPPLEAFDCYGGYDPLTGSVLAAPLIEHKLRVSFKGSTPDRFQSSPIMERYLDKLLEDCRSRGLQVLLVNTPVHPLYRAGVPPAAMVYLTAKTKDLQARFPNVRYLDWSDLDLGPASFYDGDHVNRLGAERVTKTASLHNEGLP
jgi:hypothetical protein